MSFNNYACFYNCFSVFFRYFCRAVEYDEQLRRCIIFEEDSFSQKDDLRTSTSPTHDLFDLICLDGGNGALKNEQ